MADEVIKLFEYFMGNETIQIISIIYIIFAIIVFILILVIFIYIFNSIRKSHKEMNERFNKHRW